MTQDEVCDFRRRQAHHNNVIWACLRQRITPFRQVRTTIYLAFRSWSGSDLFEMDSGANSAL